MEQIKNEAPEEIRRSVIELTKDQTISASDKYRANIIRNMKKSYDPLSYAYNIIHSGAGDKVI
jgi:hypothetical protein